MSKMIVGAGFTGVQLARRLIAEGDEVVLLDNAPERVRQAQDLLDCTVALADGNSLEALEAYGLAKAEALVALTRDDERNMIACSLVDAVYPKVFKVARVRNYAYYTRLADARRRSARPLFGIDQMLHPEVEAAQALWRAVEHGAVGNVIALEAGFSIAAIPVSPESPLAERPLWRLSEIPGWRSLVVYVETPEGAFLPNGATVLHAGDRIGLLATNAEMAEMLKTALPQVQPPPERMVVAGAGRTGLLLAEMAARRGGDVVLVDGDEGRCREAVARDLGVRVLCGDVADSALIGEEALDACGLLVAASENFDRNLVAAAYLKSRGVKKTIALTESAKFDDIATKFGIDVAVPMRGTVVDCIMSHLRGAGVRSVHRVCGSRFEVVECDIPPESRVVGKALKEISRPGEFLLLLIRPPDAGAFAVPNGDTVMEAGARVALVLRSGNGTIARLFGSRGG